MDVVDSPREELLAKNKKKNNKNKTNTKTKKGVLEYNSKKSVDVKKEITEKKETSNSSGGINSFDVLTQQPSSDVFATPREHTEGFLASGYSLCLTTGTIMAILCIMASGISFMWNHNRNAGKEIKHTLTKILFYSGLLFGAVSIATLAYNIGKSL